MRVADRATARNYLKYLNKARSDYAETNARVASGKRFTDISDDVSAGTRVLQSRADMYKVEKQLDNVKGIAEEMGAAEDAMTGIGDVLLRVHEQVKKAQSEDKVLSEASRDAIVKELKALQNEMLQFSNIQFGNKYLFGGTTASTPPFSVDKDTGRLKYNGVDVDSIQKDANGYFYLKDPSDPNTRTEIPMDSDVYMDVGLGIRMSGPNVDPDSGFLISYSGLDFMGFGKTSDGLSNNLYNSLSDVIKAVESYTQDDAKALNDADARLMDLSDKFQTNRTDIGARTHFLETMEDRLGRNVNSYKTRIDTLMGINDAEEATNQAMNDYVLKAVIQMGARILPVSLMDYLR